MTTLSTRPLVFAFLQKHPPLSSDGILETSAGNIGLVSTLGLLGKFSRDVPLLWRFHDRFAIIFQVGTTSDSP